MKTAIYLSLITASLLQAADIELESISVTSTTLEDISGEEIKSADAAAALTNQVPNISLVRRSGVANDIIVRGQKKDNINVLIDNAKVYGACPNRMDPAISHVLTNNIESIEIVEGPYDVENFGSLSALVKVKTKKPTEDIHGNINLGMGSFGFQKAAADISGGTKHFKFLLSLSGEKSGQYLDGDGNDFAQQVDRYVATNPSAAGAAYQDQYRDMDAYSKMTLMGKLFIDITDDQELRLGYTANRSDDVLYPSSKMDALYDDSNIYTAEYLIRDIGSASKELSFEYYYSDVEHPMSTKYRVASLNDPMNPGNPNLVTSALTTATQGAKIKNLTELTNTINMTLGLDGSLRNWDGTYYKNENPMRWPGMSPFANAIKKSIDDVDTVNLAAFAEFTQTTQLFDTKLGIRYDDTTITPNNTDVPPLTAQQENSYSALSANIFTTYKTTENLKFFGGLGKASRVPDARELYFKGMMGNTVGTDTLKQTTNYEVDLGMKNEYESFNLKTKLFYSMLKDYIYYNSSNTAVMMGKTLAVNAFENIDASIYGIDITGSYYPLDTLYVDFGIAYQRGKKDTLTTGQSDTNLAEIPPLKGNVALNYLYYQESKATVAFVGADTWKNYDADNGEQEIASWGIMNLSIEHYLPYGFAITAGVDNVFDKTYARSNTYKDLTLLSGGGDVMLMNEPGRYYYANARYSF